MSTANGVESKVDGRPVRRSRSAREETDPRRTRSGCTAQEDGFETGRKASTAPWLGCS